MYKYASVVQTSQVPAVELTLFPVSSRPLLGDGSVRLKRCDSSSFLQIHKPIHGCNHYAAPDDVAERHRQ